MYHNYNTRSTRKRSDACCCRTNKGSKSSDHLENVNDGTQNVETTGSDNVGNDDAVKKQDGTLNVRFIEKRNVDMAG